MILWICSVFEVMRECKHSVFLLNWTWPLWIFYLDNEKSQSLQLLIKTEYIFTVVCYVPNMPLRRGKVVCLGLITSLFSVSLQN